MSGIVVPAKAGTHTALSSRLRQDDRHLQQQPGPVAMGPCFRRDDVGYETSPYIVAPSTQGANSAPPKSKLSLLVGWPEAVLSIRSKMRWPHCCTGSSPAPQQTRHSITSSARARSVGEISRLSALAVLRLITNSIFVGCSTGRSAGDVPLNILSTKAAAR